MRYLSAALYAEGSTDVRFLKPLLLRVCAAFAAESPEQVETSDVVDLDDLPIHRHLPREQRILEAARRAQGAWIVLFIHADADSSARRAMQERVDPARALLAAEFGRRGQAVAVVPVRTTEAWTLADTDALRMAFGTTMTNEDLGLADVVTRGADHVTDPKATLAIAFERSRGRRRSGTVGPYLGRIADAISLERLRHLDAYRQMEEELRLALRALGILR